MLLDPAATQLPSRKELPKVEGTPEGSAWFWGKDDQLGRLNLLTPARILEATKLIKEGKIVNLNWTANLPFPALFGRQNFEYKVHERSPSSYDDSYHMNTQSGSQWDGFRHCGYEGENGVVFYNGVGYDTAQEGLAILINPQLTSSKFSTETTLGMQGWAEHGIAGRGVLIDYWGWKNKSYDPNTTQRITVSDIQTIAKEQGVTFRYGDILMIRTGWIENYTNMSQAGRDKLATIGTLEYTLVGAEQSEEMLDFLHDSYFAAVVGDNPAFESWPSKWRMHASILAKWGMPIGELWDLDRLAEPCRMKGQYAFFVSSAPSNMPAGVASCPNAIAIF